MSYSIINVCVYIYIYTYKYTIQQSNLATEQHVAHLVQRYLPCVEVFIASLYHSIFHPGFRRDSPNWMIVIPDILSGIIPYHQPTGIF